MYVSHLAVRDFRSYGAADLDLEPGVITLVGPNGAGKTNLVEALGYLATLGSHRVAGDAPLVRAGAPAAVVRAVIVREGRHVLVEVEITPGRANRARVNRAPAGRAADILGILRTVSFAPEDLGLVKGDPAQRRGFLDELLVARAPRWAAVRSDYDRIVKQRNALLKSVAGMPRSARAELTTLDVWDASLARTGAQLLAGRLDLVAALEPLVISAYAALVVQDGPGSARAGLAYRSSLAEKLPTDVDELTQLLGAALVTARIDEIDRGVTLVGPHRDDLLLTVGRDDLPARGYASHGESWSMALALRLGAYDLLCADGAEPVLVLDDVFAELDVDRRRRLAGRIEGAEQVLITAADAGDVPGALQGRQVQVPDEVTQAAVAMSP